MAFTATVFHSQTFNFVMKRLPNAPELIVRTSKRLQLIRRRGKRKKKKKKKKFCERGGEKR